MGKPLGIGRTAFVVLSICTASLLAGCFGIKTYPNTLDKNLHVHTATDSGSWFSRVRAAVDIHRAGEDCVLDYEGTVQLADPKIDIGIPPHRWSYLVFVFDSSSFFGNRSGTITYETLLKPRAGSQYEVAVSYRDDMYHVEIRETLPNQSTGREIERLALSACRSSSSRKSVYNLSPRFAARGGASFRRFLPRGPTTPPRWRAARPARDIEDYVFP